MPVATTQLIGRFGNQMFQYAFTRAYAEKYGYDFRCGPWIGQDIFELNDEPICDLRPGDYVNSGYAQDQASLIYTRKQVMKWFTLREDVLEKLSELKTPKVAAHRRVGDYADLGYVVVSRLSYMKAVLKFGYDLADVHVFHEEQPCLIGGIPDFLPDFYRMMKAPVLFRGNSTFSWWAATLGTGKVFSPVIEGLEGGKEQYCEFVEGNWPRFANLPFITDLHLKDE